MKRSCQLVLWLLLLSSARAADERKVTFTQPPEYPPIAAKMNLRGTVRMKVWINPDGTVRRVDYIGGHPLLAESALKALKRWKYEPQSHETTAIVEWKF
jgi:TonB family protein